MKESKCKVEISNKLDIIRNQMTYPLKKMSRVEISRASYEPLGDVEAHLKHFKPPQPL